MHAPQNQRPRISNRRKIVFLTGLAGGGLCVAGMSGAGAPAIAERTLDSKFGMTLSLQNNSNAHFAEFGVSRCTDCHTYDPLFSHPVDITPPSSMHIPANFPLIDGQLTCTTCHVDSSDDHANGRQGFDAGLGLVATGFGLCIACHDTNSYSFEDLHAISIGRAHLGQSRIGRSTAQSFSLQALDILDTETDTCLTCHDGAMAGASGRLSGIFPSGSILNTGVAEHPIGPYRYSDHLDPDGDLTPIAMLDGRVRLFDNQVGCGSCHSVYSEEANLLVMSNHGSQLCLSCHQY